MYTPSQKSLVDTLWVLEAFGKPDNPSAPETGTLITAQFSEEGILSGAAGCNFYTTSYAAKDGRIAIEMPASTMRACTKGMEQEAAYLQALTEAESYTINDGTLEITYGGGQGVLRYTSQHLPIENVLWTLVTVNGEVNSLGLVPTTALFEPGTESGKGTVGGVAMCNNYSGSYSLDQQALTIDGLVATQIRCPEKVLQAEATYLETLEAAKSYQVYGETLVITSEKGVLTFSANRAPLEGTAWRLTSMGDVNSPTIPSQGGDFTAQFVPQEGGPSGLIIGSTGCNDYNAAYLANLNELKVNLPNKTNNPNCPPSFWEQEQQFFLGLNAASTYRILGNTLQIPYDEGRQALNFTAYRAPGNAPAQRRPAYPIERHPLVAGYDRSKAGSAGYTDHRRIRHQCRWTNRHDLGQRRLQHLQRPDHGRAAAWPDRYVHEPVPRAAGGDGSGSCSTWRPCRPRTASPRPPTSC